MLIFKIYASMKVHVLTIYFDDLQVFKPSNLNPMFQSIFNIILKGETGMSRRYGVDLFKEILKDGQIQSTLSK